MFDKLKVIFLSIIVVLAIVFVSGCIDDGSENGLASVNDSNVENNSLENESYIGKEKAMAIVDEEFQKESTDIMVEFSGAGNSIPISSEGGLDGSRMQGMKSQSANIVDYKDKPCYKIIVSNGDTTANVYVDAITGEPIRI